MAISGRVRTANGLLNKWPLGPSSLMGRTLDENFEAIDAFMASGTIDPLFSVGSNGTVKAPTQDDVDNNRILKAANGGGAWVADQQASPFAQDTAGVVNGPTADDISNGRIIDANNVWVNLPVVPGVFSQDTNGLVPGPTADDISNDRIVKADGTWIDQPAGGGGLNRGGGGTFTDTAGVGNNVWGYAEAGSLVDAASEGDTAWGYATSNGNIHAEGNSGATARGMTIGGKDIKATNGGAEAMGANHSPTYDIDSQGFGSFAGGFLAFDALQAIQATGDGAFQWGPGSNGSTDTFQIGDKVFHVDLNVGAAVPVSLLDDTFRILPSKHVAEANGDIWMDGSRMHFWLDNVEIQLGQESGTGEATGFTAGAGTGVNDDSTFTGNVGATAYRVNDIVKALKNMNLLAN
jgi:hypothetical protein